MLKRRLLVLLFTLVSLFVDPAFQVPVFSFPSGTIVEVNENNVISLSNDLVYSFSVTGATGGVSEQPAFPTEFTLDATNFEVKVAGVLDRDAPGSQEYYSLWIKASDGTAETINLLRVRVVDIPDEAPAFASSPYTGNLNENAASIAWDSIPPHLDVTDPDTGDSLTFHLTTGKLMPRWRELISTTVE
ncbi:protocadherin beta-8-like [Ptychodera flava]|uniref:protocadherin beta-8-like n=1 Tax=Ptychodera flava TaxID=63121 RepID=UPI00396A3CF7